MYCNDLISFENYNIYAHYYIEHDRGSLRIPKLNLLQTSLPPHHRNCSYNHMALHPRKKNQIQVVKSKYHQMLNKSGLLHSYHHQTEVNRLSFVQVGKFPIVPKVPR